MSIQAGKWQPVISLILVMLLIQLIGPEFFRFETNLVKEHQLWRIFTGHWVHANWIHFMLNMTGFVLCLALTDVNWNLWQWVWRILVLSAGISAGFYLFHPEVSWYVGFSGVLFGLYVLAAVATLPKQLFMSSTLIVFVAVKIILEQVSSVNMTSSDLIGVPVLVDAHLYGVLMAIAIIIIQLTGKRTGD